MKFEGVYDNTNDLNSRLNLTFGSQYNLIIMVVNLIIVKFGNHYPLISENQSFLLISVLLRQVSGINYSIKMRTYRLGYRDSEITWVGRF